MTDPEIYTSPFTPEIFCRFLKLAPDFIPKETDDREFKEFLLSNEKYARIYRLAYFDLLAYPQVKIGQSNFAVDQQKLEIWNERDPNQRLRFGSLDDMEKFFQVQNIPVVTVSGNHHHLIVNLQNGHVILSLFNCDCEQCKKEGILRIFGCDLGQWLQREQKDFPDSIDILDLGYWFKDGTELGYQEVEVDWRNLAKEVVEGEGKQK